MSLELGEAKEVYFPVAVPHVDDKELIAREFGREYFGAVGQPQSEGKWQSRTAWAVCKWVDARMDTGVTAILPIYYDRKPR